MGYRILCFELLQGEAEVSSKKQLSPVKFDLGVMQIVDKVYNNRQKPMMMAVEMMVMMAYFMAVDWYGIVPENGATP